MCYGLVKEHPNRSTAGPRGRDDQPRHIGASDRRWVRHTACSLPHHRYDQRALLSRRPYRSRSQNGWKWADSTRYLRSMTCGDETKEECSEVVEEIKTNSLRASGRKGECERRKASACSRSASLSITYGCAIPVGLYPAFPTKKQFGSVRIVMDYLIIDDSLEIRQVELLRTRVSPPDSSPFVQTASAEGTPSG